MRCPACCAEFSPKGLKLADGFECPACGRKLELPDRGSRVGAYAAFALAVAVTWELGARNFVTLMLGSMLAFAIITIPAVFLLAAIFPVQPVSRQPGSDHFIGLDLSAQPGRNPSPPGSRPPLSPKRRK